MLWNIRDSSEGTGMSYFCKNKRSMTLAFGAFFMAMTILAFSFASLFGGAGISFGGGGKGTASQTDPEPPPEADGPAAAAEEEEPEPEPAPVAAHYNIPAQMRGVYLTPGVDFIATGDTSEAAIRAEIEGAIANAAKLTMNSVIIDTTYADSVIYQTTNAPELSSGFDIMEYTVTKARETGLYAYAIFDASFYSRTGGAATLAMGADTINTLSSNLREFAEKYRLDGILIDGYINRQTPESYSLYSFIGSAMGYKNFMRQSPEAVVATAAKTIRKYSPGTQIGLLADAVWENADTAESGSETKAAFTALGSGNADTKAFLDEGLVDFVAVKAFAAIDDAAEPFEAVVKWWAGVARDSGVPMYAVHASEKVCTAEPGWSAQDQLVRQLIAAGSISGYSGSIFNSLKRMVEDPKEATTTLVKYFNEEVEASHILTELAVTRPEESEFTTTEPVVTFIGASDPNFPVSINGEETATDENGFFTVTVQLSGGENLFTISHKDKSVHYKITRDIEILKDISPMGSIFAEGSMSINITALAYEDAVVYAEVNGTKVSMSITEDAMGESEKDSSYKLFSGSYTAPAATAEEQNIGNIVVYATWEGQEKSIEGALVKVNKKAKIEDGVPVVVVADQAMTYPPGTLDNVPDAKYFPLPKGAMDYAVGDEIVYKKGSDTYTYYVLASNVRVRTEDIATTADYVSGNVINGVEVYSEGGSTYAVVDTAQKVGYSFAYTSGGVDITFNNTVKGPDSTNIGSNAMFRAAAWEGNTLSLAFVKSGGFMGYKGYYDGGKLVFEFNTPPGSLKGARIAIDPGHGGRDVGALGFLSDYHEKVINLSIARLLADDLESRGAKVLLLDTSGGMSLEERVALAEGFGADMFVSVHNNTASNSAATGTEVYYFTPYSKSLAQSAAANVSGRLGTANRGAKQSYYHVTLSSQMPSILVECGFMSNQGEYEKLIKTKYQQGIAEGIANAMAATIKATATGYSETDNSRNDAPDAVTAEEKPPVKEPVKEPAKEPVTEPVKEPVKEPAPAPKPPASQNGAVAVQQIELDENDLILEIGESVDLIAEVMPSNAANKNVKWKSGNTTVASVSSTGRVKGLDVGKTRITVTSVDGGYYAVCDVTVVDPEEDYEEEEEDTPPNTTRVGAGNGKIEDMELSEDEIYLDAGETQALKLSLYPKNTADVTTSWWSSDEAVAKVSPSGVVTAVSDGICSIIAEVNGTDLDTSCNVVVTGSSGSSGGQTEYLDAEDAEYVSFKNASETIYVGKKLTLTLIYQGKTVRNEGLKWKTSDKSVADVDANGVVQSRGKLGTAKIIAYTSDERLYAACNVTVTNQKVNITSITLNKTSLGLIKGKTEKLTAKLYPDSAASGDVKWSSSNKRIASVDSSGLITGVDTGTATITVESDDGKVKAVCQIEVFKTALIIEELYLETTALEMLVGMEDWLTCEVYPDVSNPPILWKSSKPDVVSVDSKGNLKALKPGTAVITAYAENDRDIYDVCEIVVLKSYQ
ncbi:hypothetical protein FACS1894191_2640 [Clostridia bacterium]|nr:hypothetical protein FACS1894191_2640 [Clostridia bacterium]